MIVADYVLGEYSYAVDNKGRVIIPPKFRDFLEESFIITKGLDGCLFVFPKNEWQLFEKKLMELPLADRDARMFTRFFFAGAAECTLDKQGRVMLPAVLRQFADLQKTAVVVGVTNRIEIWDEAKWQSCTDIDATDFADRMAALGI
ncbi:division/cell wall cluster transcriptional repressor MraZ [Eubacterium sp.]|uniref:division/cell wall cluster transcriptional repressor MraZ n=1 Tax=Eubacterium sp. TaxID=142586 RepID=UPI003FA5BD36